MWISEQVRRFCEGYPLPYQVQVQQGVTTGLGEEMRRFGRLSGKARRTRHREKATKRRRGRKATERRSCRRLRGRGR